MFIFTIFYGFFIFFYNFTNKIREPEVIPFHRQPGAGKNRESNISEKVLRHFQVKAHNFQQNHGRRRKI